MKSKYYCIGLYELGQVILSLLHYLECTSEAMEAPHRVFESAIILMVETDQV